MLLILIIIIIIVLFFFHSCWTFFYYSDDTTYYYSILMIIVIILFLILLLLFTTFTAKERKQLHRKLTMRVVAFRRVLRCSKLDLHCAVTWPRGTSILMKDMKLSHSEITSFNLFPRKPFICYTHDMVESRTNVYENHTQPKRPLS